MTVDDYTIWDVLTPVEIYRMEVIEREIRKRADRVSALRDQIERLEAEIAETRKCAEIAEQEISMSRQHFNDMEAVVKRRRAERKSVGGDK